MSSRCFKCGETMYINELSDGREICDICMVPYIEELLRKIKNMEVQLNEKEHNVSCVQSNSEC